MHVLVHENRDNFVGNVFFEESKYQLLLVPTKLTVHADLTIFPYILIAIAIHSVWD